MTENERFVMLAHTGRFTVSELCVDSGISRKTGHKYLQRYAALGPAGLQEQSRRPKCSPLSTPEMVEKLALRERRKYPTWGPKNLRDLLAKVHGMEAPPYTSTIGAILARHGLSQQRKRRRGAYRVRPEQLTEPTGAEKTSFTVSRMCYRSPQINCNLCSRIVPRRSKTN